EAEIRVVIDYFLLRPYALQHLEDKEFRKSFQLEVKNKELETKLEESKEEVQMEHEEAEKALKTASI
ncbi:6173_t:CDS:2, partial [Entrophospora sp. SA101]